MSLREFATGTAGLPPAPGMAEVTLGAGSRLVYRADDAPDAAMLSESLPQPLPDHAGPPGIQLHTDVTVAMGDHSWTATGALGIADGGLEGSMVLDQPVDLGGIRLVGAEQPGPQLFVRGAEPVEVGLVGRLELLGIAFDGVTLRFEDGPADDSQLTASADGAARSSRPARGDTGYR